MSSQCHHFKKKIKSYNYGDGSIDSRKVDLLFDYGVEYVNLFLWHGTDSSIESSPKKKSVAGSSGNLFVGCSKFSSFVREFSLSTTVSTPKIGYFEISDADDSGLWHSELLVGDSGCAYDRSEVSILKRGYGKFNCKWSGQQKAVYPTLTIGIDIDE